MKALWNKLLCRLGLHDGRLLNKREDPWTILAGHKGTEECQRCGMYRRVIGFRPDTNHVLPWVSKRPGPKSNLL